MRGETITVFKAAADRAAGESLGDDVEAVTIANDRRSHRPTSAADHR
jgi:hypothetical protein